LSNEKNSPHETVSSSEVSDGILLPDGSRVGLEGETERQEERKSEDAQYVPVIIKRTDETRRHPDDALQHAIEEGLQQLRRPVVSLFLSSVAAGLIVGFSAMAVAVVLTATEAMDLPDAFRRIGTAFVYPLGFVVCILSGAQLFTEHTATALYPVLDAKAKVSTLVRLWAIIVIGNLLGALMCGALHCAASDVIGATTGYIEIGHHLTHFPARSLFVSAVLAGWLMALGAWLVGSSPRTIAQIAVIYIVTFLIGMGGLHHSIAGSVEMFAAMFLSTEFTYQMAVRFIAVALIGNLVGGSCFVALLNYASIRRTNEKQS
jgi:formate/nitrite transporter FocA (FNT family)